MAQAKNEEEMTVEELRAHLKTEREGRAKAEELANQAKAARELAEKTVQEHAAELAQMAEDLDAAQAAAEKRKPVLVIDKVKYQVNAPQFHHPTDARIVTLKELQGDKALQAALVKLGAGILTKLD